MRIEIPEPWLSFLAEVDRTLERSVEVHCLGGFVLALLWGLPRPTGDIDYIDIAPRDAGEELQEIAGEGSEISIRFGLSFQRVTIAEYPENYASRLVSIRSPRLKKLRLQALDVHDIVLAKLSRNSPRDRSDVEFLARRGALDRRVLEERFEAELRPYLLNEKREATTLGLWVDEFLP